MFALNYLLMGKFGAQNTPKEVMIALAWEFSLLRGNQKITQKELSEKSGVAYATVRKFETKGIISLESLLKLADALGKLDAFENIFNYTDLSDKKNLFDI
jgi:transcriptional regulator with XRE-family HTH domain